MPINKEKIKRNFYAKFYQSENYKSIEIIGEYKGFNELILCQCKKDLKHQFYITSSLLIKNKVECPVCKSIGNKYPELVKYFKNEEDAYKYTPKSNKKVDFCCPDCGYIWNQTIYGFFCKLNKCQNCNIKNHSMPNKILRLLLLDSNVFNGIENLEFEKDFGWDKRVRFDASFEIKGQKYVIEMQGEQHYTQKWMGKKYEKEAERDEYKRKMTKINNIEEIEINCFYKNKNYFSFIKENILNSKLNNIFNLENIDWIEIEKNSYNNIVKDVCDFYNNNDMFYIKDIAEHFNLGRSTIINYLKIGNKFNWCNYSSKKSHLNANQKQNRSSTKPKAIQIFKNEEFIGNFKSINKAICEIKELNKSGIHKVLNGNLENYKGYVIKYL